MPQFKLKAKDKKVIEKIRKAFEDTIIIQRQKRMTYGRWDFVVFGAADKDKTVLRAGYAEHAAIHRAPLYIASLAEPGWMNLSGVPIEEFIPEDVPEEYQGLEVIQVDPVRPLTIQEKKTLPSIGKVENKICKDYENENIAVIHSPHESDWMISVMKYLNECDQTFPDRLQESLRSAQSGKGNLFSFGNSRSSDYLN